MGIQHLSATSPFTPPPDVGTPINITIQIIERAISTITGSSRAKEDDDERIWQSLEKVFGGTCWGVVHLWPVRHHLRVAEGINRRFPRAVHPGHSTFLRLCGLTLLEARASWPQMVRGLHVLVCRFFRGGGFL